ncbi:hypothetical protein, partial [Alloalcanivorax gelatiniphagus]|uniref:hypothetical protein n=1 Tax=Alloalcanivorax gelatiniphagus TaxID=1194167 RepID=UPI0036155AFE
MKKVLTPLRKSLECAPTTTADAAKQQRPGREAKRFQRSLTIRQANVWDLFGVDVSKDIGFEQVNLVEFV